MCPHGSFNGRYFFFDYSQEFPFISSGCQAPESGAHSPQVAKKIRKITHKQHLRNGQKKEEEKSFHLAILPLILPEPFISLMKVHDASSSLSTCNFPEGQETKKREEEQPKDQPNVILPDL
jgi:hypothetical protein